MEPTPPELEYVFINGGTPASLSERRSQLYRELGSVLEVQERYGLFMVLFIQDQWRAVLRDRTLPRDGDNFIRLNAPVDQPELIILKAQILL